MHGSQHSAHEKSRAEDVQRSALLRIIASFSATRRKNHADRLTEAMQWLEGRRALEMGAEIRMLRYAVGAPGLGEKKHEVPDGENRTDGGWRDAEGK